MGSGHRDVLRIVALGLERVQVFLKMSDGRRPFGVGHPFHLGVKQPGLDLRGLTLGVPCQALGNAAVGASLPFASNPVGVGEFEVPDLATLAEVGHDRSFRLSDGGSKPGKGQPAFALDDGRIVAY